MVKSFLKKRSSRAIEGHCFLLTSKSVTKSSIYSVFIIIFEHFAYYEPFFVHVLVFSHTSEMKRSNLGMAAARANVNRTRAYLNTYSVNKYFSGDTLTGFSIL